MSVQQWIRTTSMQNKKLKRLLAALVHIINTGTTLTFLWDSEGSRKEGSRRESEIRRHLGSFSTMPITHTTQAEYVAGDKVAELCITLGARINFEGSDAIGHGDLGSHTKH